MQVLLLRPTPLLLRSPATPTSPDDAMPPGRRTGAPKQKPIEEPPTEYEMKRAENLLRNNQTFQGLGLSALAKIVSKAYATTKGTSREHSGSLYEPEESEDIEEGAVDKVSENLPTENLTRNISTHSGRSRVSKRVVATDGEDRPNRVTRQRTRISAIPQDGSTEDVLIAANSPTPAQPDDNLRSNDGDRSSKIELWNRKVTMGRDLDRISRGLCNKLPVEVVEGKRRPLVPLHAAKLASEAGITLRQHFPILPRWKDYKDNEALLKEYMGRLGAQFNMDINSEPVKAACYDLLKCAQRQVRYKLKMAYFNGILANEVRATSPLDSTSNEQWQALVDMWSESKHKNKCVKAKSSRENVQYQQKTGSRSYIAHCHAVKQKKYKDVPPTAIDLFKECHCSSKTGFTETVKDVIANMESVIADPVQEGQSSKTPIEVISQVMPRSKFLRNIGLESSAPKRSGKAVVEELQAQLEAEKQCSLNLKGTLDSLMQKVDESEAARVRQLEEFENLKNSHNETNALLRRLIGFNTPSSSQP